MKLWVIKRGDQYACGIGYYGELQNAILFKDKSSAKDSRNFPGEKVVRVKIKEVKK